MSTGCDRYEDRLVAYAAGTLAVDDRTRLETHLAGCQACRDALAVVTAVRTTAPVPPAGLEGRIQRAVRAASTAAAAPATVPAAIGVSGSAGSARPGWRRKAGRAWRPFVLPLAAAAAIAALWVTTERPWTDAEEGALEALAAEDYRPYGALPAGDGVVAGELVLSELSVEELEHLLEEME